MPLKRLLIIGAGGFGREVLMWAKTISEHNDSWEIGGFLDDNLNALQENNIEFKVISTIRDYILQPNDVFICAIGNPGLKLEICRSFIEKGAEFIRLIHPTSIVGDNCNIGRGVILCPYSVLTTNVNLGDFVTLNVHSTVGHDVIIDEGCILSGHCDVSGGAHLARGVFMGSGARVLPKANVGEFAVIGAGSVVLKRVKSHKTVFGVPAKYID